MVVVVAVVVGEVVVVGVVVVVEGEKPDFSWVLRPHSTYPKNCAENVTRPVVVAAPAAVVVVVVVAAARHVATERKTRLT